jgi:hypothetical protein
MGGDTRWCRHWRGRSRRGRVRREASCWVLRQQPVRVGFQGIGPAGPGWGVRGGVARRALGPLVRFGRLAGLVVGVGVGWLLVEMCIVGVSIFVVKLSRADGGCLGTRGR